MRKRSLVGLVSVALVAGAATAAAATTAYPSAGGIWEYGNGVTSVWSYYTANGCHGSSITRNGLSVDRSIDTASGKRSNAYANHAPWTGGYSFHYRSDCFNGLP